MNRAGKAWEAPADSNRQPLGQGFFFLKQKIPLFFAVCNYTQPLHGWRALGLGLRGGPDPRGQGHCCLLSNYLVAGTMPRVPDTQLRKAFETRYANRTWASGLWGFRQIPDLLSPIFLSSKMGSRG